MFYICCYHCVIVLQSCYSNQNIEIINTLTLTFKQSFDSSILFQIWEYRYHLKSFQDIIYIFEIFKPSSFCRSIKQFCNGNFGNGTITETHFFNMTTNHTFIPKHRNEYIRI